MPLVAQRSITSLLFVGAFICNPASSLTCDLTFQSQIENIPGFDVSAVTDTEIAVGPERVLACTNSYFTILDKNGTELDRAEIGNHPNPTASNTQTPSLIAHT